MATFTLKFERYAQQVARVEIQATSLEQAIEQSRLLDTDELEWEEECPVDGERLYGVQDENDEWLAIVQLDRFCGIPTWFTEDLRYQAQASHKHPQSGECTG